MLLLLMAADDDADGNVMFLFRRTFSIVTCFLCSSLWGYAIVDVNYIYLNGNFN